MINKLKQFFVRTSPSASALPDDVPDVWSRMYHCNCCLEPIEGVRWSCADCDSADWCAACHAGACACTTGGEQTHALAPKSHLLWQGASPLHSPARRPQSNGETLATALRLHANKLAVADEANRVAAMFGGGVAVQPACSLRWVTFGQLHVLVSRIAFALDRLRVRGAVLIVSEPRAEAVAVDFAMVLRHDERDVIVPVVKSVASGTLATICERTAPQLVFCSAVTRDVVRSLAGVRVVDFDDAAEMAAFLGDAGATRLYAIDEAACAARGGTKVCVFSSGSTGAPKGVLHNSRSWKLNTRALEHMQMPWVGVAWQPLPSMRRQVMADLLGGGRVLLVASTANLHELIARVRPTVLTSTPRFWCDLYADYLALDGSEESRVVAIYKRLGGRVRVAATGGAPTPPNVKAWMTRLPIMVHEGYGLSETTSVLNERGEPAHAGVEVRLEPVAELELDGVHKGEIVVRSPTMFEAYVGDAELTARAFTADGFYHTGDLGERNERTGAIKLIGRLANAVKLQQGVFVSIERVETCLGESALVKQMCVFADGLRDHVVAIVVPRGATVSESDVMADFRRLAKKHSFAAFELPRCIALLDDEFTVENGCLTGTGKIARKNVVSKHRTLFEALYARTRAAEAAIEARGGPRSLADVLFQLGHTDVDVAERCSFRELGGDSLLAARFARLVGVDAAALLGGAPLAHVLRVARTATSVAIDDIVRDVVRADDDDESSDVFVTGANGFLGRFIVQRLLARGRSVLAMVRAADDAGAAARLGAPAHARLTVVAGDLALERFGWPAALYEARRRRVGAAIHNGAIVNAALGVEQLHAANVGGTANVLRLVGAKPLVYVSTVGVLRPHSGYAQSKLQAEALVRAVRQRLGAAVAIVRPGAIGPAAASGEANPIDFRVLLVLEMLRQRAAPGALEKVELRFVGVERVAQRCVQMLEEVEETEAEVEKVEAVVGRGGKTWRDVIDAVEASSVDGFRRGVEWAVWRDAIQSDALRSLCKGGVIGGGGGEEEGETEEGEEEEIDFKKMVRWLVENQD